MATFYPVPPLVFNTELPNEFYNLPNNYAANFSTKYGMFPKRGLEYPLNPTVAHADSEHDVAAMAADLQRAWPDLIWDLDKKPNRWEDLLVWFDPYDIHLLGAEFLLQVLYRVQEQNEMAAAMMHAVIDEAAIDWVARHEAVVFNLRPDQDVVQLVASEETLGMKDREMVMFSIALDKHRHLLHARLLAERNVGFIPTSFAGPMMHGVPPFLPTYALPGIMNPNMVGATSIRPMVQQIRTAERLVNGLRFSAAGQVNGAAYPPSKEDHQRICEVSNLSALHGTPQARRLSQSQAHQGKSQPRRMSTSRRVRPRGYSTISARNYIDGPRSSTRRRASNPGVPPQMFVSTSRSDVEGILQVPAAYRSPPAQKVLVDSAIIAHSPPRPQALADPAIIAQSPPRQQPLNDPSIIAQGPERTPHTSPNQFQHMQHFSERSQARYAFNAPYTVPPTIQPMLQDTRVFSPHSRHNSPLAMSSASRVPSIPQGFRMPSSHNLPMASLSKFPQLSQDARAVSAFARSTSRQYPQLAASFHNRQVSQQEHNIHRFPSSSSSISTHTVKPERYEFTGGRNASYGNRRSVSQQPGQVWIQESDSKKVVVFNGKSQYENEDPDNTHTIYLRFVNKEFFDSLEFKKILDECGEVCDMSYYKPRFNVATGMGQAFVHFAAIQSVKIAIGRLNGHRAGGLTVEASQALPRSALPNYKGTHQNSKSVRSNASSRRPSIHTQSHQYQPHQYSNNQTRAPTPTHREPLTDGFQRQLLSATAQLEQDRYNVQRMGPPLEDISNYQKNPDLKTRYPMSFKDDLPSKSKFQTPSGSPKKENVPFKQATKTPSTTPRNLTLHGAHNAQNGQQQFGKKKGKKGGRKTADSSAQPTPTASPTKDMADIPSLTNDTTKKSTRLNVVTAAQELKTKPVAKEKKSAKGQLEPRKQQDALTAAPTSPNNTSGTSFTNSFPNTAPPSREASAVSLSSVAPSDGPAVKVESSKEEFAEKSTEKSTENSTLTPTKKPTKNKKKTANKANVSLPDFLPAGIESAGTKCNEKDVDVKPIADQQSKEPSDPQTGPSKSRKKVKHTKTENANHDPTRKADSKLATAAKIEVSGDSPSNSKAQPKKGIDKKEGLEAPPNPKNQSKKAGGKKDANKDSAIPKEQMEQTVDKTPEATAPNSESGDHMPAEESLKLSCDEQFPSLEPAKSPAVSIADGKRPAAPKSIRGAPPALGQFSQSQRNQSSQSLKNQSQSQSKPAVPVPRIGMPGKKPHDSDGRLLLDGAGDAADIDFLQSWSGLMSDFQVGSSNDTNSLGSITWPFVKSFRKM